MSLRSQMHGTNDRYTYFDIAMPDNHLTLFGLLGRNISKLAEIFISIHECLGPFLERF